MSATVFCVKTKREGEPLSRKPFPNELGQRILENVSKDGWVLWIAHSTMLINDSTPHDRTQTYTLNPPHRLGPDSGFLTLEMIYEVTGAEGFPGADIYGIKVRVGHN